MKGLFNIRSIRQDSLIRKIHDKRMEKQVAEFVEPNIYFGTLVE